MARALAITESNEERDELGDDGCTIDFFNYFPAPSPYSAAGGPVWRFRPRRPA
jgi:hypothetical protein